MSYPKALKTCINPSCGNNGVYPTEPDGEPEQCEFCYTEPDSVFNTVDALNKRLMELEAELKEHTKTPERFHVGGHYYPGCASDGEMYTSDCEYGCGCWMGRTNSGGPDDVDPGGDCPNNLTKGE